MKNNEVILNLRNNYDEKWIGLTFERLAARVAKTSSNLQKIKSLSIFGEQLKPEEIKECEDFIEIEPEKTEYENIHSLEELKEVIKEYQKIIEQSLVKVGITQYTLIVEFYIDNNNYYYYCDNLEKGFLADKEVCDALGEGIDLIACIDITNKLNAIDGEFDTSYVNVETQIYSDRLIPLLNDIKSNIGKVRTCSYLDGILNMEIELRSYIKVTSIKQLVEDNLEVKGKIETILEANKADKYRVVFK